jgi:hypothetical protein
MALKSVVTKEEFEKLPEAIKAEYKQDGESYLLDAPDGYVPKSKLDEFRTNNVALMKDRDALKAKYGDLDPDAAREALKLKQQLEEKKLRDAGEFDKALDERVKAMRKEHEAERTKLESELRAKDAKLSGLLIDNALRDCALKPEIGVLPKAIPTVVVLAKGVWQLDKDGNPVAMKDGQPIYGKDGTPISMPEWISNLKAEHDYLFGQPSGGGAGNTGGSGGAPKKKRSEMSVAEKSEYVAQHGQAAFLKLPA